MPDCTVFEIYCGVKRVVLSGVGDISVVRSVTSPKGHKSEGSQVRRVTSPKGQKSEGSHVQTVPSPKNL